MYVNMLVFRAFTVYNRNVLDNIPALPTFEPTPPQKKKCGLVLVVQQPLSKDGGTKPHKNPTHLDVPGSWDQWLVDGLFHLLLIGVC